MGKKMHFRYIGEVSTQPVMANVWGHVWRLALGARSLSAVEFKETEDNGSNCALLCHEPLFLQVLAQASYPCGLLGMLGHSQRDEL